MVSVKYKFSTLRTVFLYLLISGLTACSNGEDESERQQNNPVTVDNTTSDSGESENAAPIELFPALEIISLSLEIQNSAQPEGRQFDIEVVAVLGDGQEVDITETSNWQITSANCASACASVSQDNKLVAKSAGDFVISASYMGLTTEEHVLTVTASPSLCGGMIDDPGTDLKQCLKVVQGKAGEASDKWFTSPPHQSVMVMLGYQQDNTEHSDHYSFARFYTPDAGLSGFNPIEPIALFRMDGAGASETKKYNSQAELYCADLGQIRFNGRENWRLPTINELADLVRSSHLFNEFYWPSGSVYASSTEHSTQHSRGFLGLAPFLRGENWGVLESGVHDAYITCVSEL